MYQKMVPAAGFEWVPEGDPIRKSSKSATGGKSAATIEVNAILGKDPADWTDKDLVNLSAKGRRDLDDMGDIREEARLLRRQPGDEWEEGGKMYRMGPNRQIQEWQD